MKQRLLKIIKKYLHDLKTLISEEKAKDRECWIEEIESENIVSINLKRFIENQIYYYSPKDREYGKYLSSLIRGNEIKMKECLVNDIKDYVSNMKKLSPEKKYEGEIWIKQVESENIISKRLKDYIESQYHYWYSKDREYSNYLSNLIKGKGN